MSRRRPFGERDAAEQRATVERHLIEAGQRLAKAREELRVADEEIAWFESAADDARTQALVSGSEMARRELEEAERHLAAVSRSRADLVAHIDRLRRLQDELLDELPEPGA